MLKNFTPRLYQQTIFHTASKKNTLVVLPTGMGKTAIFLMLAAHRLKNYPNSKILFVGPTRPLIEQYFLVFKKFFEIPEQQMCILTGMIAPKKRHKLWQDSKIIFSTPQGLENDVLSGKISLKQISLFGFDEAHRATGNYSYVFLAKQYHKQASHERILALTASPGDNVEKIEEVTNNLFIGEIELRTQESPDVKEYVQKVDYKKIVVTLPKQFREIQKFLQDSFDSKIAEARKLGYLYGATRNYNKSDLLRLQGALHAKISEGEKDFEMLKTISLIAEALKLHHAIELIETQDVSALKEFFDKLQAEADSGRIKATTNLVKDLNFRSAIIKTDSAIEKKIEHPKLEIIRKIVQKDPKRKIIIFSQYRDMASKITLMLNDLGYPTKLFVGQQKKKETGLSQKKQKQIIQDFRENNFNILVSSSVGEEGLDIPQVDLVVFYEPIPSAIRKIQRSGRTGRLEKGKVLILSTKNTKDEAYHWVALRKEKRMHKSILQAQKNLEKKPFKQDLTEFTQKSENLKMVADYREKNSQPLKILADQNFQIELTKLEVGDYLLSRDAIVEYKTVQDFVDSIIDGRLLGQIKNLKQYSKPLIIIEGMENIYGVRKIHHKAIQGMLATITISYGIPILQTKNPKETADILSIIAEREQSQKLSSFTQHSTKPLTKKEQQEYVVASLPGIGGTLNKPLLKQFKTIKNIVNAKPEELKNVELIGPKKAKNLKELFEHEWNG